VSIQDEMRELIGVVRETYILIAGIAITQFFSSGVVVDTDPAFLTTVSVGTSGSPASSANTVVDTERVSVAAISASATGITTVVVDATTTTGDAASVPKPEVVVNNLRPILYPICYAFSLIILVTLILRFLFGSYVQMIQQYGNQPSLGPFHKFLADVCFLMFFGALLVGAALAKTVRGFMGWLALSSALGILWSVIARWRGDPKDLTTWWLLANFVQFLFTARFYLLCESTGNSEDDRKHAYSSLIIAGIVFMIIFRLDLKTIFSQLPK